MEVVLLPVYQRPEFLHFCLEQIRKAYGSKDYHYIFQVDVGFDPDVITVIHKFNFSKEIRYTSRTPYIITKQSYSLLSGYMYAASLSRDKVFLIEEDIMIATDFFEYHTAVQENQVFASLSTENYNSRITATDELNKYYLSTGDYNSLGVCFKKEIINNYIKPHFNDSYLKDPVAYVKKNFPDSKIGPYFAEQDGLIRRIQEVSGMPTAYPCTPRAYHAGFYGKNRGKQRIRMDIKARITHVGSVIFSDDRMKSFSACPEYYEDSKPVNLDIKPQSTYVQTQK